MNDLPHHIRTATPNRSELGAAIRTLRRSLGMTIEDLADASGVHVTTISKLERGRVDPLWETLCHIANGLEFSVAGLAQQAEEAARMQRAIARVVAREEAQGPSSSDGASTRKMKPLDRDGG